MTAPPNGAPPVSISVLQVPSVLLAHTALPSVSAPSPAIAPRTPRSWCTVLYSLAHRWCGLNGDTYTLSNEARAKTPKHLLRVLRHRRRCSGSGPQLQLLAKTAKPARLRCCKVRDIFTQGMETGATCLAARAWPVKIEERDIIAVINIII